MLIFACFPMYFAEQAIFIWSGIFGGVRDVSGSSVYSSSTASGPPSPAGEGKEFAERTFFRTRGAGRGLKRSTVKDGGEAIGCVG